MNGFHLGLTQLWRSVPLVKLNAILYLLHIFMSEKPHLTLFKVVNVILSMCLHDQNFISHHNDRLIDMQHILPPLGLKMPLLWQQTRTSQRAWSRHLANPNENLFF